VKILIFSDLHAHAFKPYATVRDDGMNSRLADAISCIHQIKDYCLKNDVDLILFGGDLFHVRKHIAVPTFNAVYEAMCEFHVYKIPMVLIPGNHDQADKEGTDHSIYAFSTFCNVANEPGWITVKGKSGAQYQILAIPYTENIEQLRQLTYEPVNLPGTKFLLAHLGMQGAKVGADFVYRNPHDPVIEDLNPDQYDFGFLGHYHIHQYLTNNICYVGAPLQHNWGDKGQTRGFLVYDTEAKTAQQVPLDAPQFIDWTNDGNPTGLPNPACKGHYLREYSNFKHSLDDIEGVRQSVGARSYEVVPTRNGIKAIDNRLGIGPGMSMAEVIERYVSSGVQINDDLDHHYLVQLATEVLEEVEE